MLKVYLFAVHDELDDIASALAVSLADWAEAKTTIQFVHRTDEAVKSGHDIELGFELTISKTQKLKEPLNFLYATAREHQCEFVVGIIEDDAYQDVCYFGFEEGRPDMYEIAHYLGLEN